MTVDQLRQVLRADPFKPFSLCVADGRQIRVEHPEFLALFPTGRGVIVTQPDDSYDVLDLLLVTGVHVEDGGSRREPRR